MGAVYGNPEKEYDFKPIIDDCSNHLDTLEQQAQAIKAAIAVQNNQIKQLMEENKKRKQEQYSADEVYKKIRSKEDDSIEQEVGATSASSLLTDIQTYKFDTHLEEAINFNEECLLNQTGSMVGGVKHIKSRFEEYTKYKTSLNVQSAKRNLHKETGNMAEEKLREMTDKYIMTNAKQELLRSKLNIATTREVLLLKDLEDSTFTINEQHNQIEEQRDKLAKSDKQTEEFVEKCNSLQKTEELLKAEIASMEKMKNEKIKDMQNEIENCKQENRKTTEASSDRIKELRHQGEEWRMQNVKLYEQHDREIKEKDENNEKLIKQYINDQNLQRQNLRELSNQNMSLTQDLTTVTRDGEQQIESLRKEMRSMYDKKANELQMQLTSLDETRKKEIATHQQKNKELLDVNAKMFEEHHSQIECKQQTISALMNANTALDEKCSQAISRKQETINELQIEMSSLRKKQNDEIKCQEDLMEKLKNKKSELKEQLYNQIQKEQENRKNILDEQTSLVDNHNKAIRNLQKINENLHNEKLCLELRQKKEEDCKQELIENFDIEKERLHEQIRSERLNTKTSLENMRQNHERTVKELNDNIKSKQDNVTELKEAESSLIEQIQMEKKNNKEMKNTHEIKEAKLIENYEKQMKSNKQTFILQIKKEQESLDILRKKTAGDIASMKRQHSLSEQQATGKIEEIQRKLEENKNIVSEQENTIKRLEKQLYIPVQLYCPPSNEHVNTAFKETIHMIDEKFASLDIGVSVKEFTESTGLLEYKPSIVFCPTFSRLGTDVEKTVEGMTFSPLRALVIMHHKEEHALPRQGSGRNLTAPEYKSLGGIFDMAFLSGKGVYACEMNATAVNNIVTFLQTIHKQYLAE